MNDPLVRQIEYIEGSYKTDIDKWQGIKDKLLREIDEAQKQVELAKKGLEVLQQQKRKLDL